MNKTLSLFLSAQLLAVTSLLHADTAKLEEALQQYYKGYPDQAIELLEPIALQGSSDAQYLLGNILYGLSKTQTYGDSVDPIKWYQMAADQGRAGAHYALGVIYYNRWRESREQGDAAQAFVYNRAALDAGQQEAQNLLDKLERFSGLDYQQAQQWVEQNATKAAEEQPAASVLPPIIALQDETPTEEVAVQDVSEEESSKAAEQPAAMVEEVQEPEQPVAMVEEVQEPEQPVAMVEEVQAAEETMASEDTRELDAAVVPVVAAAEALEEESEAAAPKEEATMVAMSAPATEENNVATDEPPAQTELEDFIRKCSEYTETGFQYYVDSIRGASMNGSAMVTRVAEDPLQAGLHQVKMTRQRMDTDINLTLTGIPDNEVYRFRAGDNAPFTGSVVNAELLQQGCNLLLDFVQDSDPS